MLQQGLKKIGRRIDTEKPGNRTRYQADIRIACVNSDSAEDDDRHTNQALGDKVVSSVLLVCRHFPSPQVQFAAIRLLVTSLLQFLCQHKNILKYNEIAICHHRRML